MRGLIGYLQEREHGSWRSATFRRCRTHVNDWLERLSASPALNQPCDISGESRSTFLVDFSPDRTKIASAHGDHTVRVTDVATGHCTHILRGHPRTPWCLSFHPSHNNIIASGCLGGEVRIWDLRGGGSERFNSDKNAVIASLTFHPVDNVLVFASKNKLFFWDWTQPEPFKCCSTSYEYERVRWVKFDSFGHFLYTGICNSTIVTPATHEEVVYRDREESSHPNYQQRNANRWRYDQLVSNFLDNQRRRASDVPNMDSDRPSSPVHQEGLRNAQDYAEYVTSHSRDNPLAALRARNRAARGEDSASRSSASYSMFSRAAVQPGANSPPPRPLREEDTELSGDIPRPGEVQQGAEASNMADSSTATSGNATVGSDWTHARSAAQLRREMDQRWEARLARRDLLPPYRGNRTSTSSRECATERGPESQPGGSSSQDSLFDDIPRPGPASGSPRPVPEESQAAAETQAAADTLRACITSRLFDLSDYDSATRRQVGGQSGSGASGQGRGTLYNMLSGQTATMTSSPGSAFSTPTAPPSGPTPDTSSAFQSISLGPLSSSSDVIDLSVGGPFSRRLSEQLRSGSCPRASPARASAMEVGPVATPTPTSSSSSPHPALPPAVSASGDGNRPASSSTAVDLSCCSRTGSGVMGSAPPPKRTYGEAFSGGDGNGDAPRATSSSSAGAASALPAGYLDSLGGRGEGGAGPDPDLGRQLDITETRSLELMAREYGSVSSAFEPGTRSCRYVHHHMMTTPLSTTRSAVRADMRRLMQEANYRRCDFDPSQRCPVCKRSARRIVPPREPSSPSHPPPLPRRDREHSVWRPPRFNPARRSSYGQLLRPGRSYINLNFPGERTMDGTSQTHGELNAPEHADRGTDMVGLAQLDLGSEETGAVSREGSGVSDSSDSDQLQHRMESELERQLSENDDEISRIESNYRESMRRLAEHRQRILSTLSQRECREISIQSLFPAASTSLSSTTSQSSTSTAPATPKSLPSGLNVSRPIVPSQSASSISTTMASNSVCRSSSSGVGGTSHQSSSTSSQSLDDVGPFHTLPAASGSSRDVIEVLTGSGQVEAISFSELARRMANREDVVVMGNHRMSISETSTGSSTLTSTVVSTSTVTTLSSSLASSQSSSTAASRLSGSSGTSSGPQPLRSHLLRACLTRSTPSTSGSATAPPPRTSANQQPYARGPTTQVPQICVLRPPPEEQGPGSGPSTSRGQGQRQGDPAWYTLEQRHLHPHYSRSILDETVNRPNDAMQSAINRVIAGVFMSSGEQAVASNIVPGTHRIQRWDFRQCQMPDLTEAKANVVVDHCKIHNDASIDISRDSSMLAAFVNNHGGFPDNNILAVFSLRTETFGQCLYTKSFGPNAISVSLSPSNQYVMVGLASKRMVWISVTDQMVGQILWLNKPCAGEYSMKHVTDLYHPVRQQGPLARGLAPVSINSARWLPDVGEGIVYGTNHGDLHVYRAGRTKAGVEEEEARPVKFAISTQTGTGSIRHSAFTQTTD